MPASGPLSFRRFGLLVVVVTVTLASTAVGMVHGGQLDHEYDGPSIDADEHESVRIGETIAIPVETGGNDDLVLTVDRYGGSYEVNLELTDGNADGRVVVELNTSVAATANRTRGAAYSTRSVYDEVRVRKSDDSDSTFTLEPEIYGLELKSAGDSIDYTQLLVRGRWTNGTVLSAPRGAFENLTSLDDVTAALDTGRLARHDTILQGDTIAAKLNSSALATAMRTANGSTTTARFRSVLDRNDTELFFKQTNPGTMLKPMYLMLNSNDRFRVVAGSGPETHYVLFETDVLSAKHCDEITDCPGEQPATGLSGGERFAMNLTLAGEPIVRHDDRRAFEVIEREIRITLGAYPDLIVAEPTTDQRITGRATFEPGTNVSISVASNDASFTSTERVTLKENRTTLDQRFVASFDFSSLDAGDLLTVTATARNTTEQELLSVQTGNATVNLLGNGTWTANLTAAATLPSGGFVAVHAGSAEGPVMGTSQYISDGIHPDVTVPIKGRVVNGTRRALLDSAVAVAYRDADSDEKFDETDLSQPYVRNQHVAQDDNPMTTPPSSSVETPDSSTTTTAGDRNTETTSNSQNQTAVATTTGTGAGFAIPLTVAVLLGSIRVMRKNQ